MILVLNILEVVWTCHNSSLILLEKIIIGNTFALLLLNEDYHLCNTKSSWKNVRCIKCYFHHIQSNKGLPCSLPEDTAVNLCKMCVSLCPVIGHWSVPVWFWWKTHTAVADVKWVHALQAELLMQVVNVLSFSRVVWVFCFPHHLFI